MIILFCRGVTRGQSRYRDGRSDFQEIVLPRVRHKLGSLKGCSESTTEQCSFDRESSILPSSHCASTYMYMGNSSVTDITIQRSFLDIRSLFHIFSKCKSKIIQRHYKAVIIDKAPYEFDAIFLNRLSDIVCITRHGYYSFWTLLFTYQ